MAPHHGLAARVGRPAAHATAGRRVQRVGHPRATRTGSRAGSTAGSPTARVRRRRARPRRTSATSRATCASCPSSPRRERGAETEVTRQRAESLYALDGRSARTIAHLSRTGQLATPSSCSPRTTATTSASTASGRERSTCTSRPCGCRCVVAGPGVPHGRRFDPVTTVDLAPTLAAYAGATMPGADGSVAEPADPEGDKGWDRAGRHRGDDGRGRYAELHRARAARPSTRGGYGSGAGR